MTSGEKVLIISDDTVCQNKSLDSKQEEQCSCDKYSARPVGAWSECLPDKEEDTTVMQISPGEKENCGPGKRYRRMDCYDSSGNLVDRRCSRNMIIGDYLARKLLYFLVCAEAQATLKNPVKFLAL